MARPIGEIRRALIQAAAGGPGTARELAHRGQVGLRHARYTVSRLVESGELVILTPHRRPAVLAQPAEPEQHDDTAAALGAALRGWR